MSTVLKKQRRKDSQLFVLFAYIPLIFLDIAQFSDFAQQNTGFRFSKLQSLFRRRWVRVGKPAIHQG